MREIRHKIHRGKNLDKLHSKDQSLILTYHLVETLSNLSNHLGIPSASQIPLRIHFTHLLLANLICWKWGKSDTWSDEQWGKTNWITIRSLILYLQIHEIHFDTYITPLLTSRYCSCNLYLWYFLGGEKNLGDILLFQIRDILDKDK